MRQIMASSTGNAGGFMLGCRDEHELMGLIRSASSMIDRRKKPDEIRSMVSSRVPSGNDADIILDIALTRRKAWIKYPGMKDPFFTSEGLRWATPSSAADHCARRMKRDHVMDITCGQGGQSISLARTCNKVTAIDIDPLNCLMTRLNCMSEGIQNVDVVNADCLSEEVISMATEGCAIFSDPARPPGAGERTMDGILPDPRKMKEYYENASSGMCFEIPPYMKLDKVDFECEAEYISLDGRVNRLNLYLGDLMRSKRSAVRLPGGDAMSGEPSETAFLQNDDASEYGMMFEVDPAVVKAGLVGNLMKEMEWDGSVEELDNRRTVIWSDEVLSSPFLRDSYTVLATFDTLDDVKSHLKGSEIGSVTLRFAVDPSDYWNVRNDIQKGLKGDRKAQLFMKDRYILAIKGV